MSDPGTEDAEIKNVPDELLLLYFGNNFIQIQIYGPQ